MRTLIAGFGNVLRGDDGFGVVVIERLEALHAGTAPLDDVELMEVGTGGMRMAQELLTPYDRLIIVDAVTRRGAPGTLYILAVESVLAASAADLVDMHLAVPSRALAVANALGALPHEVFLVGCEPLEVDELTIGLSPCVAVAAAAAVERILQMLRSGVMAVAGAGGERVTTGMSDTVHE